MSVPYSRLLFNIIPWYSFLIVVGASFAIFLAVREEKRVGFKKDTVIDFALIVLPCGIIGARVYYVLFSWDSYKDNLLSVFKIWEGGIAIYGAIIAGLLTGYLFCRKRRIHFLTLCDLIAPGLVLAQGIGRWGNYFNQEAYGLPVLNELFCFFPYAVQIKSESGLQWHMATFFYEFVCDFLIFAFLIAARRKWFRFHGDVISFYALLYACGRLIIEEFRMDSLYASATIRISQLLSVLICIAVLTRYALMFRKQGKVFSAAIRLSLLISLVFNGIMIFWMAGFISLPISSVLHRFLLLLLCSITNAAELFILYGRYAEGEIVYADFRR